EGADDLNSDRHPAIAGVDRDARDRQPDGGKGLGQDAQIGANGDRLAADLDRRLIDPGRRARRRRGDEQVDPLEDSRHALGEGATHP
ncbi:hypothetical protein R0K19_25020, partial [Bacillus sp. SIMBA_161]